MIREIYVLGGGGHGRVVLDALLVNGMKVSGVLDPHLKVGEQVFGVSVLGSDTFLNEVSVSDVLLVNGVGANPSTISRKRLFEAMKAKDFVFNTVLHPLTVLGRECVLGEGSQVMAGAVLQNRVQIDVNTVVNTRASIDHDCDIGAHSFVSPGAVLCGDVIIAESVFIGSGAVVLPGIQIAAHAVVGAGSVVTKNIPQGWIVAGNPAFKIGENQL